MLGAGPQGGHVAPGLPSAPWAKLDRAGLLISPPQLPLPGLKTSRNAGCLQRKRGCRPVFVPGAGSSVLCAYPEGGGRG